MARKSVDTDHIDNFHHFNLYIPTRTIILGNSRDEGAIDYKSAIEAIRNLHILHSISAELPIQVILNTPGGDVAQGLAIYDVISALPNYITISVVGPCYSMGSILLQAADSRILAPNASLMIHRGTIAYEGEASTVDRWIQFDRQVDTRADQLLLNRIREREPKYSLSRLRKRQDRDLILTAEQAVELGLADGISNAPT